VNVTGTYVIDPDELVIALFEVVTEKA